jgi:hypothetical protein
LQEASDKRTGSVNDLLTPGRNAKISDGKLKVEGTDPSYGVYFVNETDGVRVKVDPADIVENVNALLLIPALPVGSYRLEVTTQYGGNARPLRKARRGVRRREKHEAAPRLPGT